MLNCSELSFELHDSTPKSDARMHFYLKEIRGIVASLSNKLKRENWPYLGAVRPQFKDIE